MMRAGRTHLTQRLLLCSLLPALLAAQSSETVVDNDQVRVLKVVVSPHQKTRLHDHKINRVMIYLQPGRQTLAYGGGKTTTLNWKAGEVLWSPASGMHVAELVTDQPVTIIEIELKKPGPAAKTALDPLDPLKVDTKHYKVEMENDQVRVIRAKVPGHESIPMHVHARNRVMTYLTDQKFRITTPEGKVDLPVHKAGDVGWSAPTKHKEENLADSTFEVLAVEVK